jgi:CheY-like chemotaxis protein
MRNDSAAGKPVVLCVDDDESILQLTKMAFEHEGYTVLTATNGRAALGTFSTQPVDAVVLDYEMPGMNGAEIAVAMKCLNPNVPKLLFTAFPEIPAEAAKAIEGFCSKLSGLRALLSRVQTLIDITQDAASRTLTSRPRSASGSLGLGWRALPSR